MAKFVVPIYLAIGIGPDNSYQPVMIQVGNQHELKGAIRDIVGDHSVEWIHDPTGHYPWGIWVHRNNGAEEYGSHNFIATEIADEVGRDPIGHEGCCHKGAVIMHVGPAGQPTGMNFRQAAAIEEMVIKIQGAIAAMLADREREVTDAETENIRRFERRGE